MSFPALYPEGSLLVSLVVLGCFIITLRRAVGWYTRDPDRAWASLLLSWAWVVAAGGLTLSAVGSLLGDSGWALAGLSAARGALLVAAIVLVLVPHRR